MKQLFELFVTDARGMGYNIDSVCYHDSSMECFVGMNNKLNIHSCAKTITSIAFGILLKENKSISLNDSVLNFFPEYKNSASVGTENITIKNLLQMSSGKNIQSLLSKTNNKKWETDWLSWFFETELNNCPGETFYYSSHCCYTIGRIVEKISHEDVNLFLSNRLWKLMDINVPEWGKCPSGFSNCAGNIWMTCKDLSKIGTLLLNKGLYNGSQVIDNGYMNFMFNDFVASHDPFAWNDKECSQGYSLFLWKCSPSNMYRIWGAGGNFSIIDHTHGCCLTITSECDLVNWKSRNDHDLARLAYALINRINNQKL